MHTLPGETWEVSSAQRRLPSLACSPWKQGMQLAPRQESGRLIEPCHCGQTLRLPENKHRRGLEGHHDLPFQPAPDWLTGGSSSPRRQPGRPQEVRGGAHRCRADPGGCFPPSTFTPHQLHAGMVLAEQGQGRGTQDPACSSGKGGWAREHVGQRNSI